MEADRGIIERVPEITNNHGVTRDKIALTCLLHKNLVAPRAFQLTPDEMKYLEELYHPVVGALTLQNLIKTN